MVACGLKNEGVHLNGSRILNVAESPTRPEKTLATRECGKVAKLALEHSTRSQPVKHKAVDDRHEMLGKMGEMLGKMLGKMAYIQ